MTQWDTCLVGSCNFIVTRSLEFTNWRQHCKQLCRAIENPYQLECNFSRQAEMIGLKQILKGQTYDPKKCIRDGLAGKSRPRSKIWPKRCSLYMSVNNLIFPLELRKATKLSSIFGILNNTVDCYNNYLVKPIKTTGLDKLYLKAST